MPNFYEIQHNIPLTKKRDTTFLSNKLDEMEVGDSLLVRDVYEALCMSSIARKTERKVHYRAEYDPISGRVPVRVWRMK